MKDSVSVGDRFGRLIISNILGKTKSHHTLVEVICDCGNKKSTRLDGITRGAVKSCGCLQKEVVEELHKKHGMRDTPIYHAWEAIIQRCTNPNNPNYRHYGGRGIGVCERWKTFSNFFEDMGDHPGGNLSIDRINNNDGYYKENCRWATKQEQVDNRRNVIKMALQDGREVSLKEYCKELGYDYNLVMSRKCTLGWPLEDCFREQKYKHSR